MNSNQYRLAEDALVLSQRLVALHRRLTDSPGYRPYLNPAMLRHDVHELLSDVQHCLNRFLDATEKPIGGANIEDIEESDRQILEAVDEHTGLVDDINFGSRHPSNEDWVPERKVISSQARRKKPKGIEIHTREGVPTGFTEPVVTHGAVQGSPGPDPIDPGLMMPDLTEGDDPGLRDHDDGCDWNHHNDAPCNPETPMPGE